MMPDVTCPVIPRQGARTGAGSTPVSTPFSTTGGDSHPSHNSVPGIPCSAAPEGGTSRRRVGRFHPTGERVHPGPVRGTAPRPEVVRVLVWAARWVAPTAGGVFLVGGLYAGPVSVIPVPVLLALAACAFAVDTTTGGVQ